MRHRGAAERRRIMCGCATTVWQWQMWMPARAELLAASHFTRCLWWCMPHGHTVQPLYLSVAVRHGVRDACSFELCVWRTAISCKLYRLMYGTLLCPHVCAILSSHAACWLMLSWVSLRITLTYSCLMWPCFLLHSSSAVTRGAPAAYVCCFAIICVAHSWQQVLSAVFRL